MIFNLCKPKIIVSLVFGLFTLFANAESSKTKVLIYGDSLSAAYGMDLEQGWAYQLAESLSDTHDFTNASISGETTTGGLARLANTLKQTQADIVLLELGANDGLQGRQVDTIYKNLNSMIELIEKHGAKTYLIGISMPANYGPRYIDQFRGIYSKLAKEHNIPLADLYLEEFVGREGYIQTDGLHPTVKAQDVILDMMIKFVKTGG